MKEDRLYLELADGVESNIEKKRVLDVMRDHLGFSSLLDEEIELMISYAIVINGKNKECIFSSGDPSDCFYILFAGSAKSYLSENEALCHVESYSSGDLLGFLGIILQKPRKHTAQLCEDSVLIKFDKIALEKVFTENPPSRGLLLVEYDLHGFKGRLSRKSNNEQESLNEKIKKTIESILSKPFIKDLSAQFISKAVHEDLLTSMMAGCALVSSDLGGVGVSEYQYLNYLLNSMKSLGHISLDECIDKFNHFCAQINTNEVSGKQAAYTELSHVPKGSKKALMVFSACHGMSIVHHNRSEQSISILQEIASRLAIKEK